MKINEYIKEIKELNACGEAIEDALNYTTSQELWDRCERGDWMLWLIYGTQKPLKNDDVLRKVTGTKVKCARLVQHLIKDERNLDALDVAERFSIGRATRQELDAATAAAYAAAYYAYAAYYAAYAAHAASAASAAYAAYAAYYAAYAAHAASSAASAASAASSAASAAASSAYAASAADAAYAAKNKILKQCADIVREDYPDVDKLFET